jgi:hypothetical protein
MNLGATARRKGETNMTRIPSSLDRRKRVGGGALRLAILGLLAPALFLTSGLARAEIAGPLSAEPAEEAATLRLEVAMDGTSFHFQGPTNDNGFPADGTPFIIRGYIYPAGTFAAHGSSSGTNPDGSAEFPDEVIGTWYCRGWHLQDGDATTGPVVATTQIFELSPTRDGRHTIVTDGIELADFDVPFRRAVVGGTGRHFQARGHSVQVYVDFNASNGFNTSFEFPKP